MKKQCEVIHNGEQCKNEATLTYYNDEKEYNICEKCFSMHNDSSRFTLRSAEFVK